MSDSQLSARMIFIFYYLLITFGGGWGAPSLAFKVEKYFNLVDYIVTGNYSARYIFKDCLRQAIPTKDIYNLHDKD